MRVVLGCILLLGAACQTKPNPGHMETDGEDGTSEPGSVSDPTQATSDPTGSTAEAKRVFTTTAVYSGDLGGLAGGDEKCLGAAGSAGLDGAWRAWLSDETAGVDAIDRIEGTGPWVRTDGVMAFANRSVLTAQPSVELDVDASGDPITTSSIAIWTGTASGGTAVSSCLGFTTDTDVQGMVGNPRDIAEWTNSKLRSCSAALHLLCFEQ